MLTNTSDGADKGTRLCRTYTTDYAGAVTPPASGACEATFSSTSEQMDRGLLLERAPILFAEQVPLYESEMDDNGVSACTVRVRPPPLRAPACEHGVAACSARVRLRLCLNMVSQFAQCECGPLAPPVWHTGVSSCADEHSTSTPMPPLLSPPFSHDVGVRPVHSTRALA